MYKRLFFLWLLLSLTLGSMAQNKMDLSLLKMLQDSRKEARCNTEGKKEAASLSSTKVVTVIAVLKEGMILPKEEMDSLGINIGTKVGRVVTMKVPLTKLETLAGLSCIESLNANRHHQMNCRNARKDTRVEILHNATTARSEGFLQAYSGKGVLLGMVDTGIEYNHLNFKDTETGETRIKEAVLYRPLEGSPDSIREVYTEQVEIDTLTTDYCFAAHGTLTSGAAAGSFSGLQQQGMAPGADLVLCGTSVLDDDRIIDALQTTFARADELGEPCVVNLSIGNPVDWKDGHSPLCLACEALTDGGEASGRAIVFSAGNDGNSLFSAEYQFLDTLQVYSLLLPYRKNNHSWYYNPNIVAYSSDSLPIHLDYVLYDTLQHIFTDLPFEQHLIDTLEAGHNNRRMIDIDCDTCDMANLPNQVLAFRLKGNPGSSVALYYINNNAVSEMSDGGNGERWIKGSPILSISDLCCTDAVLSVGSYSDMDSLTNIFDRTIKPTVPCHEISSFSSYGKTFTGVSKPDVVAPGDYVVSSYSSFYEDKIDYYYKSRRYLNSPMMYAYTPEDRDQTYYWVADVGTSLSSPSVAGIIALWMEACPTLSVRQIREILRNTSRFDEYCQKAPGGAIQAGFGKVDAVAGMRAVLEISPIVEIPKESSVTRDSFDLFGRQLNGAITSHNGLYISNGRLRLGNNF